MAKRGSTRELAHRTAVISGVVAAIGALVVVLVLAAKVFLVLFAGVLLAILLRALSEEFALRTHLSEGISLAAVVLALVAALAAASWLVAPPVSEQLNELVRTLPEKLNQAEQHIAALPWGERVLAPIARPDVSPEALVSVVSVPLQALVHLVVFLVTGLYLAAGPRAYLDGALDLAPPERRERFRDVLGEIRTTLRRFLVGRIASMIAVGVLTGVGLQWIGVPLAAALAVIAGVLTFVPYAGPLAGAVPIAVVSLGTAPRSFLFAIGFYAIVQWIEGFVVTPVVQKRAARLLPVVTIVSELLFGWFFGLLGIIVSVPLTAAVIVLIKRLYIEDLLADHPSTALSDSPTGERNGT